MANLRAGTGKGDAPTRSAGSASNSASALATEEKKWREVAEPVRGRSRSAGLGVCHPEVAMGRSCGEKAYLNMDLASHFMERF